MVGPLLLLAATVAQPSAESLRLGRQLAEVGTLSSLLPLMKASETQELINDHPELTKAEEARLRVVADRTYETGRDRILSAVGRAYADHLSIADMRAVLGFQSSAAGRHYRQTTPAVVAQTMKSIGKMDFKGDVIAAYCKETSKLCSK